MNKYSVAAIGALVIVVGGIDWFLGTLVSHSRFLLVSGIVALVVAGILHLWQKSWQNFILPMMALGISILCAADTCAAEIQEIHKVLIRPDITPMVVRNPFAPTGVEIWIIVGVIVVVGLVWPIVQKFLRGCFQ